VIEVETENKKTEPESKEDKKKKNKDQHLEKAIQDLNKIIETQNKKIEELTDTTKRVQADFVNYKMRVDRDNQLCKDYANENIIKDLLPIIDSFEIALKHTENKEEFIKGMDVIFAQLMNHLKQMGLIEIKAIGEQFDPYKHEVMMKEKNAAPSETVIGEVQKGYIYKDKVIRHSKVKISENDNKENPQG
jgi:molecular chaperone GrpE